MADEEMKFAGLDRKELDVLAVTRGFRDKIELVAADGPPEELFGYVLLVEGYDLPSYWGSGTFVGCHALVNLRDAPGTTVAVITESHRLQTLLETALAGDHLIAFRGRKLGAPPTPLGGSWGSDVYGIYGVILYGWL